MLCGAIELQQETVRPMHVVGIDQGRVECIVNGISDTVLAAGASHVHDSHTAVFECIVHIGKVGIHYTGHCDNLRYGTCGVGYHFV